MIALIQELNSRQVLKKLKKAGCRKKRQRGSHLRLSCPSPGGPTTVPVHKGHDIKKGTIAGIEKESGVKLRV